MSDDTPIDASGRDVSMPRIKKEIVNKGNRQLLANFTSDDVTSFEPNHRLTNENKYAKKCEIMMLLDQEYCKADGAVFSSASLF